MTLTPTTTRFQTTFRDAGAPVTSRAHIPFPIHDATSSGNTAFNTAYNDESDIDASRADCPISTALTG